jgi:hypothetical protein
VTGTGDDGDLLGEDHPAPPGYRRAAARPGASPPPTKRTGSRPLSAAGVIAHVPPHAVDATFSAVRGPPNGSVKPLVTAPRMQKLALCLMRSASSTWILRASRPAYPAAGAL